MTAKTLLFSTCAALVLTLAACDSIQTPDSVKDATDAVTETVDKAVDVAVEGAKETLSEKMAALEDNPFVKTWDTPFGVPPFAEIEVGDYMPAVELGIAELEADIAAIVDNPDAPTFENTIVALDKVGPMLSKVGGTFFNIASTENNDEIAALRGKIGPMFTAASNDVVFNQKLFDRIKAVNDSKDTLELGEQEARLLELTFRRFERAGATLDTDTKAKIAEINEEISGLTNQFGQNLLAATSGFKHEVTDEADLVGLSDDFKAAIKVDGEDKWVLGLSRSVYETFMTQSENRDLREIMFNGYRLRASEGEGDNGPIAIKLAQLRAEKAEILGYPNHAAYILEYNMAKTPETVENFLVRVWEPGLAQAKRERAEMQEMIGTDFRFAAHDWWHYSEKVRQDKYAFDENATKPYFELGAVRKGAFDMAKRLFDVELTEVEIEGWNPVVTSYDMTDVNTGEHIGLFMMDMYARDSKRGGAWMSSYRGTTNYDDAESVRPIITNNLNLITPPEGQPTLMRFDEVETFFHEFGHGLHGLMTTIKYDAFSGVSGPRDYTEFPAQILEHWAGAPEMLAVYAKHYETGEVIPNELIEKMRAASNHNQGFRTTEFIGAALLDLNWHMLSHDEAMAITDAREFEKAALAKYGLIDEIEPRYRSQYFSHIFGGEPGYSSGYYAYLWSEILDADGFTAFQEKGDIWDEELAAKLKTWVYQAGGLRPADELYRNFRGSDPTIEPLLRIRGFTENESEG